MRAQIVEVNVKGLLLLFLGGCGATSLDCAALDVTACDAEPECAIIAGRSIDPDGAEGSGCLQMFTDLACQPVDQGCDSALTNAADPSDPSSCFMFTSGCIPPGWGTCDPDPGQPEDAC
ncbi:MAG: hypothetical protein ACI9MC_003780 [Kiritimatiellia bacterium]|jgi:hypothetical protein